MTAPGRHGARRSPHHAGRPAARERRSQGRWALVVVAMVVGSAGLVAGLAALPPVRFLGFVVGFVAMLAVPTVLLVLDSRTLMWFASLLATGLTVVGAWSIPGEFRLASHGERVQAEVVAHRKYYTNVAGSRNDKYEYRLERIDGTPLKTVNRGDPIPEFKQGRTVTVLVDEKADSEPRPASDPPRPESFITVLATGLLASATCVLIAFRHARRAKS